MDRDGNKRAFLPFAEGISQEEMRRSIDRNFDDKEPRPCLCCGVEWTPGDWNFHDLCDACFAEFDEQKMVGRFDLIFDRKESDYFESSEAWVRMKREK